jgi:hypothetical protein
MAKTPDLHVTVTVDTSALTEALANYKAAEARYLDLLSGALDCAAIWPHDPPGPDYIGTRCRLLKDHTERGTKHRCGPVEWD